MTVYLHEAGHTVAAFALGQHVASVEVRPDGSGVCTTGTVGDFPAELGDDAHQTINLEGGRQVLMKRAWIGLAGPLAAGTDYRHERGLRDVCMALETPPWRIAPRVEAKLRESWPAVEAVATELYLSAHIEAPLIEQLLAPHITRGAWLEEIT